MLGEGQRSDPCLRARDRPVDGGAPAGARRRGAAVTTLVGLDVGTTGVKVVAISPSGEVLATDEESYPLSMPQPGWAEQDPEDWWRAAEAVLTRLPFGEFELGLSGQMHGLVCLDERDRGLRPAILWNDQRTAA